MGTSDPATIRAIQATRARSTENNYLARSTDASKDHEVPEMQFSEILPSQDKIRSTGAPGILKQVNKEAR